MDLRLLRYFLAVVDHGGISRAAQALHLSQPSLSQAIRTLERQLGVSLFVRTGRRLVLSAQGESLVAPARRIAVSVARAQDIVDDERHLRTGRLHVAALPDFSIDPLASLIAAFRRRYPGVLVEIHNPGNSAGVVAMVRHGKADIGLTYLPVDDSSLSTRPLRAHEIQVAMSAELARELPNPVPVEVLAEIPLVELWPRPGYVERLRDTMAVSLDRPAVRCTFRHAVWELVREGAGATITSLGSAAPQIKGVEFRHTAPQIELSVGLAYRRTQSSPAAVAFLETVSRVE